MILLTHVPKPIVWAACFAALGVTIKGCGILGANDGDVVRPAELLSYFPSVIVGGAQFGALTGARFDFYNKLRKMPPVKRLAGDAGYTLLVAASFIVFAYTIGWC
jgi:hypothetical protein